MLQVACDITAYARNRYGGIARVCFHTVEQLAGRKELAVTPYFSRGDHTNISGIAPRRLRPWSRMLDRRYDLSHSLCHRRLEVRARRHIYTVHDAWSLEPNRYQSPDFQKKLGERMRREIAGSDLVLTDSDWTRKQLLRFSLLDESKVIALPAGVEMNIPAPNLVRPIPMHGVDNYVLFVGRLENRKNLPHILDAVRPLTSLHLVIVGEPGYGYEEGIKGAVGSFPQNRLVALSRVSEPELVWLYQHALVTLQPSWDEGFGLPVLEGMAAGCPVITSSIGASAEVAGDAAILVSPESPEQSRSAIGRLLEDTPYRQSLIESGRRRAGEFTWGKYGERLVEKYRSILA